MGRHKPSQTWAEQEDGSYGAEVGGHLIKVDPEDVAKVAGIYWSVRTKRGNTYVFGWPDARGQYIHRVLRPDWALIDHRDRDPRNNQRHNLRPATTASNRWNTETKGGAAGYPGVVKAGNRFRARITTHGVRRDLGCFGTAEEAARAYALAAFVRELSEPWGAGVQGLPGRTNSQSPR